MSPFWRYSSVLLIGYLPFIGILKSKVKTTFVNCKCLKAHELRLTTQASFDDVIDWRQQLFFFNKNEHKIINKNKVDTMFL